jgi:hypothetical protein
VEVKYCKINSSYIFLPDLCGIISYIAIEQGDSKRSRDNFPVDPSEAIPFSYMKSVWFFEVRLDLYDPSSSNIISKRYAQLGLVLET